MIRAWLIFIDSMETTCTRRATGTARWLSTCRPSDIYNLAMSFARYVLNSPLLGPWVLDYATQYLDAQRIHSLVTYLQELHSMGLANADHTTLLLNTYTKLKDVARLDSFIKTESRGRGNVGAGEDQELPFDLVTAIRVCRQAGYFEHASYLAKKYERHEDYLRIQIEDAGNYAEALAYLRKLGPEAVCAFCSCIIPYV